MWDLAAFTTTPMAGPKYGFYMNKIMISFLKPLEIAFEKYMKKLFPQTYYEIGCFFYTNWYSMLAFKKIVPYFKQFCADMYAVKIHQIFLTHISKGCIFPKVI